jgi:hypothetical protein
VHACEIKLVRQQKAACHLRCYRLALVHFNTNATAACVRQACNHTVKREPMLVGATKMPMSWSGSDRSGGRRGCLKDSKRRRLPDGHYSVSRGAGSQRSGQSAIGWKILDRAKACLIKPVSTFRQHPKTISQPLAFFFFGSGFSSIITIKSPGVHSRASHKGISVFH